MANARHTIELNGELYDTVTGRWLQTSNKPAAKHAANGKVIDGFTRPKPEHRSERPEPARISMPVKPYSTATPNVSSPASHSTQRSATLMRHAVKKPGPHINHAAKPVLKKQSHLSPASRLARAGAVSKSERISKFGAASRLPLTPEVATLPVQAPPLVVGTQSQRLEQQIAAISKDPHKTIFEQAMQTATSHQQPKPKKQKRLHQAARKAHLSPRSFRIASSLTAAVIIAGFFLYQSAPNLSVRLASRRAGVSASLPGYHPAGFSMSRRIQYSPGQIVLSYHSNSDERAFNLTQKKTDLTEQKLVDQIVSVNNRSYQAYQNNGRTIYIYDNNNAAWLERGVLYQVEGQSALSSDQLINLASSI